MSNEEISEGINRLADIAEKSPKELKAALRNKSLDERDQLSHVILDVRKLKPTPEMKDAIRLDHNLAALQSRANVMRLLDIKAGPTKDESLLETAVASRLRGFAEMTKDIPGVNFVTGFFKNISGRGLQRKFYEILAYVGKAPAAVHGAVGGLTFGPLGGLASAINFGDFASRKVAEFDIQDAINEERLVGETITFSGLADITPYKTFAAKKISESQPVSTIKELALSYIKKHRELTPGAPITVTLGGMLAQDEIKAKIEEKNSTNRIQRIAEKWKAENVETVKFGNTVSAKKISGKWEITVPELGLKDGEPVTAGTKKLKEALKAIPTAESIVIEDPGTQKNPCTLDFSDRSITLTTDAIISDTFNRALNHSDQKLSKIVFATPIQLQNGEMFAEWNGGTLLLASHNHRTNSLEHIETMLPLDSNMKNGALFRYNPFISSWQRYISPVSAA